LAFSGGEIFLRHDLVEITDIFYQHNRPAIILFPTNGLLTETIVQQIEVILQHCPQSTIVVKLSLDGPKHIHDAMRGVRGAYEKTLATCEALGNLVAAYPNFELGINSVFCATNQDHMDQLIDDVLALPNITTHTVSLIRGDLLQAGLKEVDLEKYRQTILKLEENLKRKTAATYRFRGGRLKTAQDILQRRLIYQTALQQKQQLPCYAGRLNLVLTETGDLYPCEAFSDPFGNLRNHGYDVNVLLNSKRGRDLIRTIGQGCFCTHECYMMTNILFNPAQYPRLLREYLRL
jgi:MoaA/NifB/PqqE/SkfB family radical SAM enzyme